MRGVPFEELAAQLGEGSGNVEKQESNPLGLIGKYNPKGLDSVSIIHYLTFKNLMPHPIFLHPLEQHCHADACTLRNGNR